MHLSVTTIKFNGVSNASVCHHFKVFIQQRFVYIYIYMSVYQAYRVLVGRPERRRLLRRPRRRWEDNIKMYLQEVGWGAWTGLIWLTIGTGDGLL
jgi:hypothetical protein